MAKLVQLTLYSDTPEIIIEKKDNYTEFVQKFELRKTTDDCYTPPAVYDAVIKWLKKNYLLKGTERIVRPFKPGGDYLNEDYSGDCVVVDNPPFSIYAKIVKNYVRLGVKFFLFAPALTTFIPTAEGVSYVIAAAIIIYENGARVRTNFCTNLTEYNIIDNDLKQAIEEAQFTKKARQKNNDMPQNYFSSAQLCKYVKYCNFSMFTNTNDYCTHDMKNKKIFGAAIRFTNVDVERLKNYSNEQ